MIAKLEFVLPDEKYDLNLALDAHNHKMRWDELHDFLRKLYKYENKDLISIEELRSKMVEIADEYPTKDE